MGELYRLEFASGKSYIGITEFSAAERFAGHEKALKHNRKDPVYRAWRKHGKPKLIVLAILEERELAETEIRAIKVFNTLSPNGYNISEGGNLSPMRHPEARLKVSKMMIAAWSDPANAKKYSDSMRGNSNRKGKPNSEEHSAKVSAALKGKPFTEEHKEALRLAWVERKRKGLGVAWNKGLSK